MYGNIRIYKYRLFVLSFDFDCWFKKKKFVFGYSGNNKINVWK